MAPVHGPVPVPLWRWPLLTGWSPRLAGRSSVERAHWEMWTAKPYVVPGLEPPGRPWPCGAAGRDVSPTAEVPGAAGLWTASPETLLSPATLVTAHGRSARGAPGPSLPWVPPPTSEPASGLRGVHGGLRRPGGRAPLSSPKALGLPAKAGAGRAGGRPLRQRDAPMPRRAGSVRGVLHPCRGGQGQSPRPSWHEAVRVSGSAGLCLPFQVILF